METLHWLQQQLLLLLQRLGLLMVLYVAVNDAGYRGTQPRIF